MAAATSLAALNSIIFYTASFTVFSRPLFQFLHSFHDDHFLMLFPLSCPHISSLLCTHTSINKHKFAGLKAPVCVCTVQEHVPRWCSTHTHKLLYTFCYDKKAKTLCNYRNRIVNRHKLFASLSNDPAVAQE